MSAKHDSAQLEYSSINNWVGLSPEYLITIADRRIAMLKVTGSLQKSTEIMKLSNQLIKLPAIGQAMREMSMEMTKVGIAPCRIGLH